MFKNNSFPLQCCGETELVVDNKIHFFDRSEFSLIAVKQNFN